MATIQDIAKKAGVTKSTVSRYLNGGSISLETAQKIEKIIDILKKLLKKKIIRQAHLLEA